METTTLRIKTKDYDWVIPARCDFVRLIIEQQKLSAEQLTFASAQECESLTKQLSLIAMADECLHQKPSIISEFSRSLVKRQTAMEWGVQ